MFIPMDFLDELQRTVSLSDYPQRIVSLVPSVTETLFELGAGERVVGVTSFCTHPPEEIDGEAPRSCAALSSSTNSPRFITAILSQR